MAGAVFPRFCRFMDMFPRYPSRKVVLALDYPETSKRHHGFFLPTTPTWLELCQKAVKDSRRRGLVIHGRAVVDRLSGGNIPNRPYVRLDHHRENTGDLDPGLYTELNFPKWILVISVG